MNLTVILEILESISNFFIKITIKLILSFLIHNK